MRRIPCIALALIMSISLYSQYPELAYDKIDKALLKNARSIVRYDKTYVTFHESKGITTLYDYAITAKNEKGNYHMVFQAHYKKGTSKIDDIEIEIIDANGNRIEKIKGGDIEDIISYDDVSMVVDSRRKVFLHEPEKYPYTIKVKYKVKNDNSSFIPPFYPIGRTSQSVEQSSLEIENLSGTKIFTNPQNLEKYRVVSSGDLKYEAFNLTAIKSEPYMTRFSSVLPSVFFSPEKFTFEGYDGGFSDWNGLGQWYQQAFLDQNNSWKSEVIESDIFSKVSPSLSAKEIVTGLYEYIQENTRYISISLDEGGLKPMDPNDVHQFKYGDCKALSFYMKSLLDLYEIPSNYVVVQADSDNTVSFHTDFASVAQGNHIIVNVPLENDTIWVDCTSATNPVGFLGAFTDDRQVLLVNEKGGQLARTPAYDEHNACTAETSILLSADGTFKVDMSLKSYGIAMQPKIRRGSMDKKALDDYFEIIAPNQVKGLKSKAYEHEYQKDNWKVLEKFQFAGEDLAEAAGDYLLVPIKFHKISYPKLKKDKNRVFDIYFPRTKAETENLTITIPDGYEVMEIPEETILESKFGEYSISIVSDEDNKVVINRNIKTFKNTYPASDYEELKSFFDKIKKTEKKVITLKRKTT